MLNQLSKLLCNLKNIYEFEYEYYCIVSFNLLSLDKLITNCSWSVKIGEHRQYLSKTLWVLKEILINKYQHLQHLRTNNMRTCDIMQNNQPILSDEMDYF